MSEYSFGSWSKTILLLAQVLLTRSLVCFQSQMFFHFISANAQSLNDSMETDQEKRGTKRTMNSLDTNADDSDDESMGVAPPVNDIYRRRQQKRVQIF